MFCITPLHSKINSYLLNRNHSSASELMDEVFEYLENALPHGSGIDSKWKFEQVGSLPIVMCSNAFHAMDNNGYYCGYVDFEVKINLESLDFDVKVNEEDIKTIYAGYATEMTEDENEDYNDVDDPSPYLDDLDDYLYETISFALERYLVEWTIEFAKNNYRYLLEK